MDQRHQNCAVTLFQERVLNTIKGFLEVYKCNYDGFSLIKLLSPQLSQLC